MTDNPMAEKLNKVVLMIDYLISLFEDQKLDSTERDIELYKQLKALRQEFA